MMVDYILTLKFLRFILFSLEFHNGAEEIIMCEAREVKLYRHPAKLHQAQLTQG